MRIGNQSIRIVQSLPFGQANQYNFGLSLSQNIFNGGRVAAQTAAANAGRSSADSSSPLSGRRSFST